MRIAAITNSRIPSLTANSIQAMKVCDALTALGHEPLLIAPAEAAPAEWLALAKHYGLTHRFDVQWLPSARVLKRFDFVWYAQSAAQRFRPDLIYTWLPQSATFALWRKYSTVLEMHADVAGHMGAWWLRRFWSAQGRKRMLVTTRALRAALERSTGLAFPDDMVQVAPNGVDFERYAGLPDAATARRELGLPDCPTAGFTGHFYQGRGMELLFALAQALPDVSFLWVGGTQTAVDEWRGKLASSGARNVVLTGFVENSVLPRYQAASDVLLMPYSSSISSSSGQDIAEVINPMKMFEYMAAQRAILTADIPSIHEVLDENCAAFCAPGDVEAWKTALQALLQDAPRRAELARNARREVEAHSWTARAQRALAGLL
jgi:glycosyltransferase involved in cell wall biosynthesis